jgi:hypothetical protein
MAINSDARKHIARAQRLQGEVLAATERLEDSARILAESVRLAEAIKAPREVYLSKAALGMVLTQLRRGKEAEAHLSEQRRQSRRS